MDLASPAASQAAVYANGLKQEAFFKVRLLNDKSIRWLYTQRVKLHLNSTKENETDIEKEWKNLQNIIKSAANKSLGTIKK